jgi:hypothetical protein
LKGKKKKSIKIIFMHQILNDKIKINKFKNDKKIKINPH